MTHGFLHTASQVSAQTTIVEPDISAMVAARICHDLVSPIGAIANGLELMQVAGLARGAELDLVLESTNSANAKLRFFRIAFGMVSVDQMISQAEIHSILTALSLYQKHKVNWQCSSDVSRRQVKLVFLLLMCLETTLPWGGEIEIAVWQEGARLVARSERLKIDDTLWASLDAGHWAVEMSSARIQFALANMELKAQQCALMRTEGAGTMSLDITFT